MRFINRATLAAIAGLALLSFSLSPLAAQGHHGHAHGHGHHHHTAPNGGTLLVLGNEAAHLELLLHPTGQIAAFVLDAEAEKYIRISQPKIEMDVYGGDAKTTMVVTLLPVENPLTGEKKGDTSYYASQTDQLKNMKKFNVNVRDITIKGVNFKNVRSPFPEGNHP